MHILVTGANGFVGRSLVRRLLQGSLTSSGDIARLTIIDQYFDASFKSPRVATLVGDFSDADVLREALAEPVDVVFHLASVPGGQAEADTALGCRVNLMATLALFEQLAAQGAGVPRVVFASTVAVYGPSLLEKIDANTPLRPVTSYGAHKHMGEIMLTDMTRRGLLDGRSLRLPGIVARPGSSAGHGSSFMSDVMRSLAAGKSYICPVPRDAMAWWMSLPCCIDNLLHAARLDTCALNPERVWPLPVLNLSVGAIVDALVRRYGSDREALVRYEPIEKIAALFARQPVLITPEAEALGFRHDGDVDALVRNALINT